ncbi:UNVERIFIED_CONTAM: hypothetical protein FKN15_063020 [Acipenser sinensis]
MDIDDASWPSTGFKCGVFALSLSVPTKPPIKPAVEKPKEPSNELDLGDALGGGETYPQPTKPAAKPPPRDKGNSGGDFGLDDLKDSVDGGYKPDDNQGGSAGGSSDTNAGGEVQGAGSGQLAGIISAVGVAVLGAASSFFAYQKKKLCFKVQGGLLLYNLELHLTLTSTPGNTTDGQTGVVLRCMFDEVIEVKEIDSRDAAHLALMKRPELGITFTKLHCWALIKYTKCVFLDADTLVLCNVDELFDREEISAAPDPGWPDCFNTGVFVFRPSLQTYNRLFQFAVEHGSFDGGDQGLLNSFFNDWAVKDIDKHLPFIYNLSSSIAYTYLPAFRQPAMQLPSELQRQWTTQLWAVYWAVYRGRWCAQLINIEESPSFDDRVPESEIQMPSPQPSPDVEPLDLAASVSELSIGTEPEPYDPEGRQKWEEGHMDYMGKDSFENIKKKLDRFLE